MSQHRRGSIWRFSLWNEFVCRPNNGLIADIACLIKRSLVWIVQLQWSCTSFGNKCRISKRFPLPAKLSGCRASGSNAEIQVLKSLRDTSMPRGTFFRMTKSWAVCETEGWVRQMQSTLVWLSVSASLHFVLSTHLTLVLLWSVYKVYILQLQRNQKHCISLDQWEPRNHSRLAWW